MNSYTALWSGRVAPTERFCGLTYDEMREAPEVEDILDSVIMYEWDETLATMFRTNYPFLW